MHKLKDFVCQICSKNFQCRRYKLCEDGLLRCKECMYIRKKTYTNKSKHYLNYQKNYLRWTKYGLTETAYCDLERAQNGLCKICKTRNPLEPLVVDHCHKTGRVRGLLCGNCNRGLGFFADNMAILVEAAQYLYEARE